MTSGTGRWTVRCAALLLALVGAACTSADRVPRPLSIDSLAAARCSAAVVTSLEEWGAVRTPLPGPPPAGGGSSYRFPTGRIGVWVEVSVRGDGEAEITRLDPDASLRRRFTSDCRPTDEVRPGLMAGLEAPAGARLTDELLAEELDAAGGREGLVVYAWSPHMPLSVDGWREISAAADGLALGALPSLIAHADPDFAVREATRGGIPTHGLRVVSSVELVMRDLQVHAPAIVVFAGNRVSPVLPGYRNADGYREFLEAFLEGG